MERRIAEMSGPFKTWSIIVNQIDGNKTER